jgi:hypothetical protein
VISIPNYVGSCGEYGYGFMHSMLDPLEWWIPLPIFVVSLAFALVIGRKYGWFGDDTSACDEDSDPTVVLVLPSGGSNHTGLL